ncbi:MAG: 50S ribosomal protein L25 [Phycisphaerales bacterium]|jgi:large subunit ribosomal protein L25|nr:50S ribosomal protein L25 [Phycisphaerales bacterium]
MTEALKATTRTDAGTRKARALRKEGLLPGVLYGHGEGTQSLTLNAHALQLALRNGEQLLDIELDGKHQNVLIKAIQYDTWGKGILHIDLTRVNMDELVTVTIQIHLVGTPAGVEAGGSLQQALTSVDIECRVDSIPEEIRLQVNDLQIDDSIHLSDLELPEGAKLLGDPAALVCNVITIAEEVEGEEGEEGEGGNEPEVIGAKPDEDEEEA